MISFILHWFFDETRFCQPTPILNKFVYFTKAFRRNALRAVPFSVFVHSVVFLMVFRRNVMSVFDHDSDLRHGLIRPLPNGFRRNAVHATHLLMSFFLMPVRLFFLGISYERTPAVTPPSSRKTVSHFVCFPIGFLTK